MSTSTKKNHYGNLSPEFAVLGLLYGGPMHGYDLHHKLVTDLGQVWHLSQSQAYAILKRLEMHGEIKSEIVAQEKLPARQLLSLTSGGRRHFSSWLQTPAGGSIRAIRMEFLTRLYFTRLYEPGNIGKLFAIQYQEVGKHILRLTGTLQDLPSDQLINRMSLEMRIRQLNLVLDWLEDCRKLFGIEKLTQPTPGTGDLP